MAFGLPAAARFQQCAVALDQQLYGRWNLGEQLLFGQVCARHGPVEQPSLPADRFEQIGLRLGLVGALVTRYVIRLVDDHAAILLDAVGVSLLTPLQQVVRLNSLSCSVNAACALLLNREIKIDFARASVGAGPAGCLSCGLAL